MANKNSPNKGRGNAGRGIVGRAGPSQGQGQGSPGRGIPGRGIPALASPGRARGGRGPNPNPLIHQQVQDHLNEIHRLLNVSETWMEQLAAVETDARNMHQLWVQSPFQMPLIVYFNYMNRFRDLYEMFHAMRENVTERIRLIRQMIQQHPNEVDHHQQQMTQLHLRRLDEIQTERERIEHVLLHEGLAYFRQLRHGWAGDHDQLPPAFDEHAHPDPEEPLGGW